MGKVVMVFFLLMSTIAPVFSQESETEDSNEPKLTAREETEETNEEVSDQDEEETIEARLMVSKQSYTLEAHSSIQISIDEVSEQDKLSFKSKDSKIVSVDDAGFMNALSAGETSVEIRLNLEDEDDLVENISIKVLEESGRVKFKSSEFFLIRDLYFDVDYVLEGNIKASELIWESSDPSIAAVENGRVTGLKLGSATITASSADSLASMKVYVSAPLKSLAFNPDRLEMIIGDQTELPSLVYAPYDTTTNKNPVFTLEKDNGVVELDGKTLRAKKVGESTIKASIGEIVTELTILVRPDKNSRDADLITLNIESQDQEQITFVNPDLSVYKNKYFSINLPTEESIEFLRDKDSADIFIMLDDILFDDDMKAIDEMIIDKEIMEVFEGKDVRVHLLNQKNKPQIVYEFSQAHHQAVNLKVIVNDIDEKDDLFALVQTQAYQVLFNNLEGFPQGTVAKIPAEKLDSHLKQLHFVYEVKNKSLIDTGQELSIDSKNYLNVELNGDHYLITLSKVSSVNDSKVIVTLSLILFTSLISGVLFYYHKTHKKN